uniref:LIM/homeobox protein Awh n=1 Tax=Acrobeloides nanus TaxID=290746 RepID=A0A914BZJ5_9BILA
MEVHQQEPLRHAQFNLAISIATGNQLTPSAFLPPNPGIDGLVATSTQLINGVDNFDASTNVLFGNNSSNSCLGLGLPTIPSTSQHHFMGIPDTTSGQFITHHLFGAIEASSAPHHHQNIGVLRHESPRQERQEQSSENRLHLTESGSRCFGCREPIHDRIMLSVNNHFWHSECLCCSVCSTHLEALPTCYWRENSVYCKGCYNQQFQTKCASCQRQIQSTDWVRRARSFVYHLACFSCDHCKRQLSTGEQFSLQDNRLLCKQHYLELVQGEESSQKQKTKRVRTTFADEQLGILQAHFQIDSNPDGADLERIANLTGLSKRVTQVWFQNSRARQKKYQGHKKGPNGGNNGNKNMNSGRSSTTDSMASPRSPTDSVDDMMYPTSVTTSLDEASTDRLLSTTLSLDSDAILSNEHYLHS